MTVYNNNNSIPYYLCAESTAIGHLQTQHSVGTSNYIMDKHNIKSKTNYRQAMEEKAH
jgi:cytidine deaminase